MDLIRLFDNYKRYLSSSEVKSACDNKIYRGLVKIETGLRSSSLKSVSIESLNEYFSKPPANIKFFKTSEITSFIQSLTANYSGWSEEAKKLDIYCKALTFLSIVKLAKFWTAEMAKDSSGTVASTGVSNTVFQRVKLVQQILDISDTDMKVKKPDRATLLYLEMGLKRIISMEVGSDDWDK